MPKKLSPQAQVVLAHLRRYGSITPVEASSVHRIRSVSTRISELKREAGLTIKTEHKKDFTGQRYASYVLDESERGCECHTCTTGVL